MMSAIANGNRQTSSVCSITQSGILINTARGGLVRQDALVEAL